MRFERNEYGQFAFFIPNRQTRDVAMNLETQCRIAKRIFDATVENGGCTFDLQTNSVANLTRGYLVSVKACEVVLKHGEYSPESIRQYILKHARPIAYIGTWLDDDETLYLDITYHYLTINEALRVGRKEQQLAIYDCENCVSLYLADFPDVLKKRHVDNVQPHSTGEFYPLSIVTVGDIRQGIGRVEVRNIRVGKTRKTFWFGPYHVSPTSDDMNEATRKAIDWAKWYSGLFSGKKVG